jgi:hypothetical protein
MTYEDIVNFGILKRADQIWSSRIFDNISVNEQTHMDAMEPHGLSPWYLHKKYPPTPLGAEALWSSGTKASEGYPPLAKSAEATSFNTS